MDCHDSKLESGVYFESVQLSTDAATVVTIAQPTIAKTHPTTTLQKDYLDAAR
jgi:hypothetical protein